MFSDKKRKTENTIYKIYKISKIWFIVWFLIAKLFYRDGKVFFSRFDNMTAPFVKLQSHKVRYIIHFFIQSTINLANKKKTGDKQADKQTETNTQQTQKYSELTCATVVFSCSCSDVRNFCTAGLMAALISVFTVLSSFPVNA